MRNRLVWILLGLLVLGIALHYGLGIKMSREDIQQEWPRDSSAAQTAVATLWSLLEWLMKTFLVMARPRPKLKSARPFGQPQLRLVVRPAILGSDCRTHLKLLLDYARTSAQAPLRAFGWDHRP